ncbi:hypothetical protein N5W20_08275 [Candidatus Kirkpatrickella diaphorinae]|uniref:Uncharacterized protein n=1 Tax=Candidatus Kirkpatrickella diaphorinae TaxID=2984322 RepID=A0ABY6GI57_9PROT|nr:hypothetical protein [Candidatus Kirkpatrickella diaphorinae]UYH51075.1 hypothetical protein N5W20_08275 [Candidatus Kirkpatrickella diaphorinae]
MGHNYAKPARAEGRLAQLIARLPDDWGVEIERPPHGGWMISVHKSDGEVISGPPESSLLEALEAMWRLLGPPERGERHTP